MNAQAMLGVLIGSAIKSTLILAAVLLIVRHQRRSAATFRHAILTAGVFMSLVLPLLTAALPKWRVAVLPAAHGPASRLRPADPLLPELAGAAAAIHSTSASIGHKSEANFRAPDDASSAPSPAATRAMNWTWRDLVLLTWLLGIVATLSVYLTGHVSALALARSAYPAPGDRLHHRFRQLAKQMGIRRSVLLRVGGRARTPMTMGIFRPTVSLSTESRGWPPSAVDELAHIKRRDPAVQLFAWIACAIYWFNPLVWLVAARIRKEREFACDDAVLRQDAEPAAYARLLVDVARAVQSRWLPVVPMARPSSLKDRVRTILDESADRRPMRIGSFVALAAMAVILLSIAPLKLGTKVARAAEAAPPSATSAADLYLAAAKILRDNDGKNIMCPAASTLGSFYYPPYPKEWTAMESADFPANAKAREMAHRARSLDKVIWPDEKLPNGDFSLTYLNELRNLANELADAAIWEHLQGDDAKAMETLRDLLHMSRLVRQSRHREPISPLVSISVDELAMSRLNAIVSSVQLTKNPTETKKLSVSTVRTLISELAAGQLDPDQIKQNANADGDWDRRRKTSERLVIQTNRFDVELDMTRLNLACHLYQLDHGTWPPSLDALQPYVSQIPIDRLGDGTEKIGYIVIKRGLPDGSDRPLIYSRYNSTVPLFYRSAQPGYDIYLNDDPVTGKHMDLNVGGQFRDVAGWSPANRDNPPPTTRPIP